MRKLSNRISNSFKGITLVALTLSMTACPMTDLDGPKVLDGSKAGEQAPPPGPGPGEFLVSPHLSRISGQSDGVVSGSALDVTLSIKDENDKDGGDGHSVVFSIDSAAGTFGPVTHSGGGKYTATLTATSPGTYTVSATVGGIAVVNTFQITVTEKPRVVDLVGRWKLKSLSCSGIPVTNLSTASLVFEFISDTKLKIIHQQASYSLGGVSPITNFKEEYDARVSFEDSALTVSKVEESSRSCSKDGGTSLSCSGLLSIFGTDQVYSRSLDSTGYELTLFRNYGSRICTIYNGVSGKPELVLEKMP